MSYPLPFQWGVACGAVLTELNQGTHGLLGGAMPGDEARATATEILSSWWGVEDRDTIFEILGWLAGEGHRGQWNDLLEDVGSFGIDPDDAPDPDDPEAVDEWRKKHFVQQYAGWIGKRSLVAWDAGRLVSVAGWGFHAGMLDPGETWGWVLAAAQAVQRTYGAWTEYGQHYKLGRMFWREGEDPKLDHALQALTTRPDSPWLQLPWEVPLAVPNVEVQEFELG
jgi:hypothetical protein